MVKLTGYVYESSLEPCRRGRFFENYPVRVIRRLYGRDHPILVGDKWSDQLGWVSEWDLHN